MKKKQSEVFTQIENKEETPGTKKHQRAEFILLNEFCDKDFKKIDRKNSNHNLTSLGSLNNKCSPKAVVSSKKKFFSCSQKNKKDSKLKIWIDRFAHDCGMSIVSLNKKSQLPPIEIKEINSQPDLHPVGVSLPENMPYLLTPSVMSTPKLLSINNRKEIKRQLSHRRIKERNLKVDLYHLTSLAKSPYFTPTSTILDILEGKIEKLFKPHRNLSADNKLKLRTIEKKPQPIHEETPELLHSAKLAPLVPLLNRVFFHPNKFFQHFKIIVINLFDFFIIADSKLLKLLKKISHFAHIVFVVKEHTDAILKKCESADIWVSGIYLISCKGDLAKYAKRCLSYSQIFLDFNCKKPEKNCFIITTHCLAEGEGIEDCLISNGLVPKVFINQAPVPCYEYPEMPLVFILPSYDRNKSSHILKKLLGYIQKEFTRHPDTNYTKIFQSEIFRIKLQSFYSVILHKLKINWKKFSSLSQAKLVFFR